MIRDRHIDPTAAGITSRPRSFNLNPAINLTNAVVALMRVKQHAERILSAAAYARTVTGAVAFKLIVSPAEGLLVGTTLAISATAEKFKTITTTAVYLIAGVVKTKAATDNLVFSAAHVVTANLFGIILVEVDAAGAVSTKVPLATQAYASAALALAALPAQSAAKVAIGYIQIANNALDWVANTDDLTNGSDLTTATFTSLTAREPLTGVVTPVAVDEVDGVVKDATVAPTHVQAELDEYIAILATTDGTGALVDGRFDLVTRAARTYRGE